MINTRQCDFKIINSAIHLFNSSYHKKSYYQGCLHFCHQESGLDSVMFYASHAMTYTLVFVYLCHGITLEGPYLRCT